MCEFQKIATSTEPNRAATSSLRGVHALLAHGSWQAGQHGDGEAQAQAVTGMAAAACGGAVR